MHRVRTLIPFLEYTPLRKSKVLPKQTLFTKVSRGGTFPKIAKKMGYTNFGCFMEIIIQEAIVCSALPLIDVFEGCREQLDEKFHKDFDPKDYIEIGKMIREHFCAKDNYSFPTFEPEWEIPEDKIVGHPDVVTEDCVYDIKTTGKFNAMRTQTIFQILSYYCLAQKRGLPITHVGLILPAQHKIFKVDISGWNWKPFWDKLKGCIDQKSKRESLYSLPFLEYSIFESERQRVGTHISKEDLLKALDYRVPLQFFVGSRVSTKITTLTKVMTDTLKNRLSPPVFIHAPYNINLSKPYGTSKKIEDKELDIPWTCYQTREYLRTGESAGVNGVVVHCGKRGGISEEEALKGMYDSLCHIAPYVKKDSVCPILLETSSGQSGEILCDPEDFANFYCSLPEDIRQKIKICVDTCHVFAAGYDPMEFIEVLEKKNIPIALIHYNDSKVSKGSKKDRHAAIGHGHIGIKPLFNVLMWANKNNVPCVHE